MEQYQHEFIRFLIEQEALLFGEFKLKSGRISPYFFNAGRFNTAATISRLGEFYADAIIRAKIQCDILFGPAYKGIPITVSVAMALYKKYQLDLPFCFNRKEEKLHGEGGNLIGSSLKGRVLLVEDVITSGITFKKSAELIAAYSADLLGIITALDRQERGGHYLSAFEEIRQNYQIRTLSIIQLQDIIDYLQLNKSYPKELSAMLAYKEKYGVGT
jgi:orotate phosphoribosyltransferase